MHVAFVLKSYPIFARIYDLRSAFTWFKRWVQLSVAATRIPVDWLRLFYHPVFLVALTFKVARY